MLKEVMCMGFDWENILDAEDADIASAYEDAVYNSSKYFDASDVSLNKSKNTDKFDDYDDIFDELEKLNEFNETDETDEFND